MLQAKELAKAKVAAEKYRSGLIDRAEGRADLGYKVNPADKGVFATQAGVTVGATPGEGEPGEGEEPPEPEPETEEEELAAAEETAKAIAAVQDSVDRLRDLVNDVGAKAGRVDPNLLALIERGEQAAADRDAATSKHITELATAFLSRPPRVTVRKVTARNADGHIDEVVEKEVDGAKPVGPFATFDECVAHMMSEDGGSHDDEGARRICGALEAEGSNGE